MDLPLANEQRTRVEQFRLKHRTAVLTLLFTDLVGSTRLKQDLGDFEGVTLIQSHHSLVRELLGRFPDAEEIDTAGDSFFIIFIRPSDAARFALLLQSRLRPFSAERGRQVSDRIGIHIGEVLVEQREDSAKSKDLYGIQVDTCARVMSLAHGNQILLTRAAFDNARPVLKGEDIEGIAALSWLNHGPYLLKGVEEALEICEVGETDRAVLRPPPDSEKVHRHVSADAEPVLGWRPAIGQAVPNTRWVLEQKLGEGGFGEVWLGRHETLKQPRVFKFCFRADRVRSLKREVTLFRVLKEKVGCHPNVVAVEDVFFDQPPFYLMMEYVAGRDLATWCAAQGGAAKVALETRLEIVAEIAEALQAAHEAGVIHRDVKPSNILISNPQSATGNSRCEAKLTDFGIGQIVSQEVLAGMTRLGFTQTMMTSGTQSGSQMYMAPELLAGTPASIRSDIYSLGVVLYQLLLADFHHPITTDWAANISDPLLRDDLKLCFAGNPQDRFVGAAQLAKQLRSLPQRREELARQQSEAAVREKAAYRRGMIRSASLAAVIIAVVAVLALVAFKQSYAARKSAKDAYHAAYCANLLLAQAAWDNNNLKQLRQILAETESYPERGFEWYYWQRQCNLSLLTLAGHSAGINSVAFAPDGKKMVTGSFDNTAKVWEVATGRELLTLTGHSAGINSVAFSSDGERIVTGSLDWTARVWDSATGRELLKLQGQNGQIVSAAFSPDGRRILTSDQAARVWEADMGRELFTLEGHIGWVRSAAFSPDGKRIVTGGEDQTAKVWDSVSGRQLLTLKGHSAPIWVVAFSRDGQRIATGSFDNTAKVWDSATGLELLTLKGHTRWIRSVAFSPDGQRIVTAGLDQTAKVWEAATGRELLTLKGHIATIESVAFLPDGQRIVTGSLDQTVKVWDAGSSRELVTLKGHGLEINSVAFSPDGQRIATGCEDQTAKVWEAASGRELLTLKRHSAPIGSVAFSSDGQRIITGSDDQTAKVWDASSGRELFTLKGHSGAIESVAFSPDGQRIITGSLDQTARVWDAASGRQLLTLNGHSKSIMSVAFSSDSRRILTGSEDQTAKVWEAASGRQLLTLNGHDASIYSAAFSSDDQRIVTGSFDQTARVWDAASGRELVALKGHSGRVLSVGFSPDGQRIVTGSWDNTAKVWDASSGRELLTLKGHSARIWSVAFSPDGRRIVTGSDDKTANVWEAASKEQVIAWQKKERPPNP